MSTSKSTARSPIVQIKKSGNSQTPQLSDAELKAIEDKKQSSRDYILSLVHEYGMDLYRVYACTFGLSAWFKAYIKSPDFQYLSEEHKGEAFVCYENLLHVLEEVDEADEIINPAISND